MSRPLSEPSFPKDLGRVKNRVAELDRRPGTDELTRVAWQDYDPFLLATGANPSNWSATGKYIVLGKTCLAHFEVVAGSGFSEGTGDLYYVSLPVEGVQDGLPIGSGMTLRVTPE